MKIEYSTNNSGGDWWLKDKDWKALEAAGWSVVWGGTYFCPKDGEPDSPWNKRPRRSFECIKVLSPYDVAHKTGPSCQGHQAFLSADEMTDADKWLGTLAKEASLECETPGDAMRSFERATGQDVTDEGCNCCGCPHYFRWEGGSASGDGCLEYLHPGKKIPKSLRDAIEGS